MSDDETTLLNGDDKLNQLITLVLEIKNELVDLKVNQKELADIVDRRLKDTRPIWESILTKVEAIESGFDNLKLELKQELALGFRRLEKRMDLVHKDYEALRLDNALLEERLEQLESNNNGENL
jgi:hypothetical protein